MHLRSTSLRSFRDVSLLLMLGWFTVLMARITWQYVPFSPTAAFLQIKQADLYMPVSANVNDADLTETERQNIDLLKRFEQYATDHYDTFGR